MCIHGSVHTVQLSFLAGQWRPLSDDDVHTKSLAATPGTLIQKIVADKKFPRINQKCQCQHTADGLAGKIVKSSTFFAPDHLKVWPTVGPGSTGNLDWIMQICIIIESNEVFLDQNFCRVLSWNYDFKKTIIFNLWLLNHCPLWEPKFSDPDARRQTFVSFFFWLLGSRWLETRFFV